MRRMCLGIVALCLLAQFVPNASAKRAAPAPVKPLVIENVRYSADAERHLDPKDTPARLTAYVLAHDTATDKLLWKLPVFEVRFQDGLETDVQEVHITAITAEGKNLVVQTESRQEFLVDPQARTVRGLIRK